MAGVAFIVILGFSTIVRLYATSNVIGAPHYVFFGCFVLAVVLVCAGESRISRRMSKKAQMGLMWISLLACYGACVGMVAMLLVHFLQLRDWAAIAVSMPLGFPALLLLARMSEG